MTSFCVSANFCTTPTKLGAVSDCTSNNGIPLICNYRPVSADGRSHQDFLHKHTPCHCVKCPFNHTQCILNNKCSK